MKTWLSSGVLMVFSSRYVLDCPLQAYCRQLNTNPSYVAATESFLMQMLSTTLPDLNVELRTLCSIFTLAGTIPTLLMSHCSVIKASYPSFLFYLSRFSAISQSFENELSPLTLSIPFCLARCLLYFCVLIQE